MRPPSLWRLGEHPEVPLMSGDDMAYLAQNRKFMKGTKPNMINRQTFERPPFSPRSILRPTGTQQREGDCLTVVNGAEKARLSRCTRHYTHTATLKRAVEEKTFSPKEIAFSFGFGTSGGNENESHGLSRTAVPQVDCFSRIDVACLEEMRPPTQTF